MLTREAILSMDDRKPIPVDVPEWGGTVHVRTMTGTDLLRYQSRFVGQEEDSAYAMAGLVALTACDDAGALMFSLDDVPALAAKSGVALTRVWAAARKINLVTDADVDDLAGKSAAAPV